MKSNYDASKEFTPFTNRGKGGALLAEVAFKGHPNKKNYRKSVGKPNPSRHAPNHRDRVGSAAKGYEWFRADGSKVQQF